ncbi:MAG: hypothetical protein JSR26_02530 [Proteobacteria bacterium]|nr:hypothetical protein [Pseudomonadota bacterium]
MLETYAVLAEDGEHLLGGVLKGTAPQQWSHYPDDDAIDSESGFQWFYHSHSPEDRPGAVEHGHIHLFARRQLWAYRLRSKAEREFAALTGHTRTRARTRHLLCIGLDAKGVPTSLFTVNSWVTGDLMLSADGTERLLANLSLATGHPPIDTVIESVVALCRDEIHELLAARDAALCRHPPQAVLDDRSLEVLSEIPIDLDRKLPQNQLT